MTDNKELPLSDNPDLTKGIIRVPPNSKTHVKDIIEIRDKGGARVKYRPEDGGVVISVDDKSKKVKPSGS